MPQRGPLLTLLLVPLLLLGPVVFSGRLFLPQLPAALEPYRSEDPERAALLRDGQNYTHSDRLYPVLTDQLALRQAVRAGELPLWEPDLGLGAPLFAESIAGAAYPPNWLALLVPPERAAGPLAMLSVFLAGLGVWLFLGRLGLGSGARLFGALAYQVGGWGVANLYYFMKFDAALWFPWALWAVEGIARGKPRSGLALTLALTASVLAGMLGVGAFVCAGTALFALVRLTPLAELAGARTPEEEPTARIAPLVCGVLFSVLGLAGAGVLLLPTIEASRESERQEASVETLLAQSLPVTTLAGTLVHDFVGSPTESTPSGRLPVAGWITPADEFLAAETANQLEWNTYALAIVVALALVALVATPRRALLPALLLLFVLGFAQGWPLVRLCYHLPGLNAGHPARVLALAWFLWPWLAALGVEALATRAPRALATLLGSALVVTLAGLGLWAGTDPADWATELDTTLRARFEGFDPRSRYSVAEAVAAGERLVHGYALLAGVGVLLLGAGALGIARRERGSLLTGALAVGLLVEGLVAADGHVDGRPDLGPLHPDSAGIEAVRSAAGDGRVIRLAPNGRADVEVLARPQMLQPYGIADVTPWIVFPPRRFNELFAAFDPASRDAQGVSRLSDPRLLGHPALDLARVSCVLSRTPLEHPRLEPVLTRPEFHVYRRSGALPLARHVQSGVVATSDAAVLTALSTGVVDWDARTLLSPDRPLATSTPGTGRVLTATRPTRSSIRVELEDVTGGWLVVHEQSYPGWRATVDGETADLVRADHVYQAVPLPPGASVVELEYAPRSFGRGVLLTLGALTTAFVLSRRLRA